MGSGERVSVACIKSGCSGLRLCRRLKCETDMNVVQLNGSGFIEIQGTAEDWAFSAADLDSMLSVAQKGMTEIFEYQEAVISKNVKNEYESKRVSH